MVLDPSGYKDVTQDPEVMVCVIFKILTVCFQTILFLSFHTHYPSLCDPTKP